MSLTRADLEARKFQQLLLQSGLDVHVLSEAELEYSIAIILQQRPLVEDVWVFAYGSLIWNPIFHFEERRVGTVHGWHRQFCQWTPLGRGTPENPGLVLGLEQGKTCQGLVYRIAAHHVRAELLLLWRREMIVGSYIPRWVEVVTGETTLEAIAFTANPAHSMYAGNQPDEILIPHIATAHGQLGSCLDYLNQTIAGLKASDIEDAALFELQRRVMAYGGSDQNQ